MNVLTDPHAGPWTESDYFALGETPGRVELFDGSLLVSPSLDGRHQHVARRLAGALDDGAEAAGLFAYRAINVRLGPGRVFIPDLAVTPAEDGLVVDAARIAIVGEVVSPQNAGLDRFLRPRIYAEAGIEWYLVVELEADTVTARLLRLADGDYVEHAVAKDGETLTAQQPFAYEIDPRGLLRRR